MRPASLVVFSLLSILCSAQNAPSQALSLGTAGQQSLPTETQTTAFSARAAQNCPVTLRAQHLPDGDVVKTDGKQTKGIGQRLRLTIAESENRPVTEATLLVHGLTPKGRTSKADVPTAADVTRREHVDFKVEPDRSSSAELWISGLSSILRLEILSLTYSDGSRFVPARNSSCAVTPDLFMPVRP